MIEVTEERKSTWQKDIQAATDYFFVLADFIPNNETLMRHIGRLSKVRAEIHASNAG